MLIQFVFYLFKAVEILKREDVYADRRRHKRAIVSSDIKQKNIYQNEFYKRKGVCHRALFSQSRRIYIEAPRSAEECKPVFFSGKLPCINAVHDFTRCTRFAGF
jgi:hypothetical protein